jgi:hypothetical protein
MIRRIVFCVVVCVACSGVADAIIIKDCNCGIVHESSNQNLVDTFLEDVLFLLPDTLSETLYDNYDALTEGARFQLPDQYWKHKVISEDSFKKRYYSIAKNYTASQSNSILAKQLGSTIVDIIEVAMRSPKYDPLKEALKRNVSGFLQDGRNTTYQINNKGFKSHSFDAAVEKLYGLNQYEKLSLYPELVTVTANLWTSVWIATGHSDTFTLLSFTRRPVQLGERSAWTKIADKDGEIDTIRDVREAAIVINNLNSSDSTLTRKIVEKRINDNIDAMIIKNRADAAHLSYRKDKGMADDVTIINTEHLLKAKYKERDGITNPRYRTISITYEPCSNSGACDSLERYLQNK